MALNVKPVEARRRALVNTQNATNEFRSYQNGDKCGPSAVKVVSDKGIACGSSGYVTEGVKGPR